MVTGRLKRQFKNPKKPSVRPELFWTPMATDQVALRLANQAALRLVSHLLKMIWMELPPSFLVALHPAFSELFRWVLRSLLAGGTLTKSPRAVIDSSLLLQMVPLLVQK